MGDTFLARRRSAHGARDHHHGIRGGLIMSAIKRDRGVKDYGRSSRGTVEYWTGLIHCVSPRQSSFT